MSRRDRFDVLERFAPLFEAPEPSFEGFLRRRDRKRRNQRLAAGIVGFAIFVAAVWIVTTGGPFDRSQTPATSGGTGPSGGQLPEGPNVDYVLDLNTGEATRLPKAIIRSLGEDLSPRAAPSGGRYAASPDGSTLAYVALGDDKVPQILVAGIDGTNVRQVTHDPNGATSPAWSPDRERIAYVGGDGDEGYSLYVLDLAGGEATPILGGVRPWAQPQFISDGSSILYTAGTGQVPGLRTVPVAGGKSTLFIEPGPGLNDAGNGSVSPDGSLVTYLGSGSPLAPDGSPLTYHGTEVTHAGPGRFLSNVDGSGFRLLPGYETNPAGAWSPDGSRIVDLACRGIENAENCTPTNAVIVVDVATGDASQILALGVGAIWLDDHTLLIDR